jgi:hypothetical protein
MARKPPSKKPPKTRRKRAAAPKQDKKPAPEKVAAAKVAPVKYAHVFDDPNNVKRAIRILFLVCGLTFVLDFVIHRHVDHPWESLIGFYAVYGFVACVLLVLAAKAMRVVLMRKDDYYDE